MMVTSLKIVKNKTWGSRRETADISEAGFLKKNDHYIKPGIKENKSFYAPNFNTFYTTLQMPGLWTHTLKISDCFIFNTFFVLKSYNCFLQVKYSNIEGVEKWIQRLNVIVLPIP